MSVGWRGRPKLAGGQAARPGAQGPAKVKRWARVWAAVNVWPPMETSTASSTETKGAAAPSRVLRQALRVQDTYILRCRWTWLRAVLVARVC